MPLLQTQMLHWPSPPLHDVVVDGHALPSRFGAWLCDQVRLAACSQADVHADQLPTQFTALHWPSPSSHDVVLDGHGLPSSVGVWLCDHERWLDVWQAAVHGSQLPSQSIVSIGSACSTTLGADKELRSVDTALPSTTKSILALLCARVVISDAACTTTDLGTAM